MLQYRTKHISIVVAVLISIPISYQAFNFLSQGIFRPKIQNQSLSPRVQAQILGQEIKKTNARFPARLIIPSIQVDAAVEDVGLTPEGAMDVPGNIFDVGWFAPGFAPGDLGNAVIAGHLDGPQGNLGVFSNLNKLKPGDPIYIADEQGSIISFVVRESRMYDPGYAEDVFATASSPHLNLVTCDGVWDGKKKSYTKRLVVFADLAPY